MSVFNGMTPEASGLEALETRARLAQRSLIGLCEDLDAKVAEVKAAPPDAFDRTKLEGLVRELRKALLLALETEGKVADARSIERGGDGLDLGAAEDEVRRRLACLRAASDAGRVLDGAE